MSSPVGCRGSDIWAIFCSFLGYIGTYGTKAKHVGFPLVPLLDASITGSDLTSSSTMQTPIIQILSSTVKYPLYTEAQSSHHLSNKRFYLHIGI